MAEKWDDIFSAAKKQPTEEETTVAAPPLTVKAPTLQPQPSDAPWTDMEPEALALVIAGAAGEGLHKLKTMMEVA